MQPAVVPSGPDTDEVPVVTVGGSAVPDAVTVGSTQAGPMTAGAATVGAALPDPAGRTPADPTPAVAATTAGTAVAPSAAVDTASRDRDGRDLDSAWGEERSVSFGPYGESDPPAVPGDVEVDEGRSTRRLLLVGGLVALAVGVAGLAAYFLLGSSDEAPAYAGGAEGFVWPEPAESSEDDLTSMLLGDVPSTTTTTVPPTTLPVPLVPGASQSAQPASAATDQTTTTAPVPSPEEHVVHFTVVANGLLEFESSKVEAAVGDRVTVKAKDPEDSANTVCGVDTDNTSVLDVDSTYAEAAFDSVRYVVARKGTAKVVVNLCSDSAESITVEVG